MGNLSQSLRNTAQFCGRATVSPSEWGTLTAFCGLCYRLRPMRGRSTSLFNGRLARSIVILFLAYAGIDMTNPQLCNDEFTPGPVQFATAERLVAVEPTINSIAASKDSRQEQLPSESCGDEDCFCCCTHVLPTVTINPSGSSDLITRQPSSTQMSVASADRSQPYHPPRFV